MRRILIQRFLVCQLNDLTQIHHPDSLAHKLN